MDSETEGQPQMVSTGKLTWDENADKLISEGLMNKRSKGPSISEHNLLLGRIQQTAAVNPPSQGNALYPKLLKERMALDNMKKMELFEVNPSLLKNSESKPFYLLTSNQIDRMIYFHKKYLEVARMKQNYQSRDSLQRTKATDGF